MNNWSWKYFWQGFFSFILGLEILYFYLLLYHRPINCYKIPQPVRFFWILLGIPDIFNNDLDILSGKW